MPVLLAALGALAVSLDSSLNMALPAMADAFGVGPGAIRWVIICYVLTYALTAFAAGLLADRLGPARVFIAGLWLSCGTFIAYAGAGSFETVLVLRVTQGVGGGLIYGTAPALVTLSWPPDRHGRGLGLMSLGLGVGLAVGPLIGGSMVTGLGWVAAFLFRAPIMGVLGVLAVARLGHLGRTAGAPAMVRPRDVWRLPVLGPAILAFLANYSQFAIWLLVPFFLVSTLGLSAAAGSLFFMLAPLGTALASPLGGWATDRIGPLWPVTLGLAAQATGLFTISRLDETSAGLPVGTALLLAGVGLGLFQVPNLARLMAAFPRAQQGAAGGLGFLSRTLGSAVGVQVTAMLFDARLGELGFLGAFQWALLGAAGVCAGATLLALVTGAAAEPRA